MKRGRSYEVSLRGMVDDEDSLVNTGSHFRFEDDENQVVDVVNSRTPRLDPSISLYCTVRLLSCLTPLRDITLLLLLIIIDQLFMILP